MKKLFVIFILSQFSLFSQINENEFYNTLDLYLQVHKIDKGEYIFYGNRGGIIRTYDSGDNYVQNYSGTNSNILNLENHKDYIVGITDNYEFMASQDKGSHWIISKLTDSIVSMDASDSFVVMASLLEDILISSNVGKSWDRIKVTGKYFRYIFIIEDRIYTIDKNNSIDYTDDFGKSWTNIKTPEELFDGNFVAQRDNSIISLTNIDSFFRINSDLTITKYDYDADYLNVFIANDEGYVFVNANSETREISYYNYNIDNKTEELVYNKKNYYFFGNTFRIYSIDIDENLVFITLENKAIMKSIDYGKTWEVVTYTPIFDGGRLKVFDEKNWSIVGSSLVFKSTDGGVTFKPGKDILIDTSDNRRFLSFIRDFHYFTKDSAIYFLSHTYNNTNIKDIYTTNDGGNTLKEASLESYRTFYFVANMDDYLILQGSRSYGGGSGRTNVFYKYSEGSKIDSLHSIDSVYTDFFHTIHFNDKVYMFYSQIENDQGKLSAKIAVSSDSLKNIKEIYSVYNDNLTTISSTTLLKSKNGNIYFVVQALKDNEYTSSYFRLDTETDLVYSVETPFSIVSGYYLDDVFIEDQGYFTAQEYVFEDNSTISKFVEVKVEGTEFVYDTIGDNNKGLIPLKFIDSEKVILIGKQYQYWKQIEPDRLTSVEQTESRTENLPIYPFAPSPNPAKEKIKVKFYTESMEKIENLKVHLVNIATGTKVEIKDYDISFTNNWNGEIAFDISDFSIGSYLINLSIDDYNRSSKLIITK
ncbi:MAG: hypothetical protein R2863_08180 [Candidatus Kapaibacterium sp.]